jgi:Protein of unknown function (DUF4238)
VKKARSIRIDPNAKRIPSLSEGPRISLEQVQELADDPMGTWFPSDVATNIKVLSDLFGCDVLVNASEDPFLTSDAPAVVYHPQRHPGRRLMRRSLRSLGCEITLPLSPKAALLFRHKKTGIHDFLLADADCVFEVNYRTITRAREKIISDRLDISFVRDITERVAQVDHR